MSITSTVESVVDDMVRLVEGGVELLDHRVFPESSSWILARSDREIAGAIAAGVTRDSSSRLAALAALEITASHHAGSPAGRATGSLRLAGHRVLAAIGADTTGRQLVSSVLTQVEGAALDGGESVAVLVHDAVAAARAGYAESGRRLAEHAVAQLPDGARVLGYGLDGPSLVDLVTAARTSLTWVIPEQRPTLRGARLTAHLLRALEQDVTLIADGAVATVLDPRTSPTVDVLVTSARQVTMDGHAIHETGVLGAALAARAFGVPVHALVHAPDPAAPTSADLEPGVDDGDQVLSVLGTRTASPLVEHAHHPALDVTPPEWLDTIITDRGPFVPGRVGEYWVPVT